MFGLLQAQICMKSTTSATAMWICASSRQFSIQCLDRWREIRTSKLEAKHQFTNGGNTPEMNYRSSGRFFEKYQCNAKNVGAWAPGSRYLGRWTRAFVVGLGDWIFSEGFFRRFFQSFKFFRKFAGFFKGDSSSKRVYHFWIDAFQVVLHIVV